VAQIIKERPWACLPACRELELQTELCLIPW
jgi:hypothetical protein